MLKPYSRNIRTVEDRHYLSTFTFDTSKYCFVLCTYPLIHIQDLAITDIEIYSPRNTRRMYRIKYDREITLCDSINPMTDYVVSKDNTLYIIETSYNNMRIIKKVIHDSVEELEGN